MFDVVRSVWGEPRPPDPPAPGWRDWALVGIVATAAIVETAVRTDLAAPVVSVLVAAGLAPTLLWRRSRPLLMVAIVFGVCGLAPLIAGDEPELNTLAYVLIVPYSLYRWGSGREAVLGSAIIVGKLGLSAAYGSLTLGEAAGGFFLMSAVVALGAAMRYRASSRARELEGAKLLERERLARDLHDTVAHHVSAMAIRAQAGLATMGSAPEAAADALRVIEAEASRTLTEMRTMVRALRRDQPAELTPSPGIAELERLADHDELPVVDLHLAGELDGIPPAIGAAIYRLAQESVTNARRHARHATRIEVHVLADDTSVHLRVSDDGDAATARVSGAPGYGLVGMIERAGLLGGSCDAGPNPGRGWTVTAVLPRTGSRA